MLELNTYLSTKNKISHFKLLYPRGLVQGMGEVITNLDQRYRYPFIPPDSSTMDIQIVMGCLSWMSECEWNANSLWMRYVMCFILILKWGNSQSLYI
jgi:hypothetical protein